MTADDMVTRRDALRRAAYVLGGALSAPTVAGVLAGCEVAGETGVGGALAPRVSRILSAEQDEMNPRHRRIPHPDHGYAGRQGGTGQRIHRRDALTARAADHAVNEINRQNL